MTTVRPNGGGALGGTFLGAALGFLIGFDEPVFVSLVIIFGIGVASGFLGNELEYQLLKRRHNSD